MCHTYILYSATRDRYYIGSTNNLDRRLREHNSGHTKSTRSGKPWDLVFSKKFDSPVEAHRFEFSIKRQKSRRYIQSLIEGDQPG